MTIYTITVVVYDHYDYDLWTDTKVFTDQKEALAYYQQECKNLLAQAQGEIDEDDEDGESEYYVRVTETIGSAEYFRDGTDILHIKIRFDEFEV